MTAQRAIQDRPLRDGLRDGDDERAALRAGYRDVRELTERLASPLSPEDQVIQSMPDVSPTKWHRGHTTWFFETFLLEPQLTGYDTFDAEFRYLFNSYYEAVGPRPPRNQRGLIMTAVRAAAILIIGSWIFGVHYQVSSWLALVAIFWMTMGAVYGLGMLSSSLFMLFGRDAWHTANLFQEPVYFISGFYFPVRSLGGLAAMAASIIPLTLGLDAIRQLIFSGKPVNPLLPVWVELLALLTAAAIFNWTALKALKYMEKLGKATGRLTLKAQ